MSALSMARFRVCFGLYLLVFTAMDWPYLDEMYTFSRGTAPRDFWLFLQFRPLLSASDVVHVVWFVAIAGCALLTVGVLRRPASLVVWLCLALWNVSNIAIRTPEQPTVHAVLLALAVVPPREGGLLSLRDPSFYIPPLARAVVWFALVGENLSAGVTKLVWGDASWSDGTALYYLINARSGWGREWIAGDVAEAIPGVVIRALSFGSVIIELSGVVLVWFRRTRALWWLSSLAMHFGILASINVAQVSLGMIVCHWFLFEPAWVDDARALRRARPHP